MSYVPRKDGFRQVCVWPHCTVNGDTAKFEADMLEHLGIRTQFLEEITTKPDFDNPSSGGRIDLLFAVHTEDVVKFAIPRFQFGIRWIEDVLDNESRMSFQRGHPGYSIYPEHLSLYREW